MRRRKVKTRTVRRRASYRRSPRKQSGGFLSGNFGGLLGPLVTVGWGYLRDGISDKVSQTEIAKKFPASAYTDEILMYGLAWGAGKLGLNKMPIARKVVSVAKTVELARIGQTFNDMRTLKKTGSIQATAQSGYLW